MPLSTNAVRLSASAIAALLVAAGPTTVLAQGGSNVSIEQQVKDLKAQVELLQEQAKSHAAQRTADAALAKAVAEAMKGQVSAESELEKAKAQAEFAKLAGIKAGLDGIGAPPGKEGKITVGAGTTGALLLELKEPMIQGLARVAKQVANDIGAAAPGKIALAADADIQVAVQAQVTLQSLKDAAIAINAPRTEIASAAGQLAVASGFEIAAAAGLVLKTFTDLSKFFRSDTSLTLFDAGEEANSLVRLFLERELNAGKPVGQGLVRLDELIPDLVTKHAKAGLDAVDALRREHQVGSDVLTAAEKLGVPEQKKIEVPMQKLRAALAIGKELLDALHPARKADGFWSFVTGLYKHERLAGSARLTLNAKAQTVQVIKSRVFAADRIEGRAAVQVDFRLIGADGAFLAGRAFVMSFDPPDGSKMIREPAPTFLAVPGK